MQKVSFASVFFRPKVGPRSKEYELDETQHLKWCSLTPRNLTQSYHMNSYKWKELPNSQENFHKNIKIHTNMMEINHQPQRLKSVRLLQYFSILWQKFCM